MIKINKINWDNLAIELEISQKKKDSKTNIGLLLEKMLYLSKKYPSKKDLNKRLMKVSDMAKYLGIARQTMYDYIPKLVKNKIIKKKSYMKNNSVNIGYILNATNLEELITKWINYKKEKLKLYIIIGDDKK